MRWLTIPLLVSVFTLISTAQSFIVGNESTKVYWAISCGEAHLVPLKDYVRFEDTASAEAKGFRRSPSCQEASNAVIGSAPLRQPTKTVGDVRKDSVSLDVIQTEFEKHRFKTVKVVGNLMINSNYWGPYRRQKGTFYSFLITDSRGGMGAFYIRKTSRAETLRKAATDNSETLMAECTVRIEGVDGSRLYGSLQDCKIWAVEA